MPQLTDQALEALLKGGESESVEFCQSLDTKKIAKNICAFANDLPDSRKPGVMFIGVKNDGSCAGLEATDEMLQKITHIRSDGNLLPLPVISVRKAVLSQCEVIAIEVQPSKNPPLRYEGSCWIRTGPSVRRASEADERRLREKRQSLDLPFDSHGIEGASEADLDTKYFESKYWPLAVSPEALKANKRNLKSKLQSLGLLDHQGRPSVAAMLIMGKNPRLWLPGAYIQFIRFEGEKPDPDTVKTQEEISGTLPEQIQQTENILKANISKSLALTKTTHIQSFDYPARALNQLLRNAVMRRDYQSSTPAFVRWFSDRIEITSPGGPYGEANKENFGHDGVVSHRNPSIAAALKTLGFVEKSGFGIFQARKLLKENGNPDLKFKAGSVVVAEVEAKKKHAGMKP